MNIYIQFLLEDRRHCIYKITNLISDKSYIGRSINFNRRMKEHQKPSNSRGIDGAITKHGKNNFSYEIIDNSLTYKESLKQEIYNIKKYNTFAPNGYNLTEGGDCVYFCCEKQTKEHIEKRISKRRGIYKLIYKDGRIDITNNLNEYCIINKLNYSGVKNAMNGYSLDYKGIVCEKVTQTVTDKIIEKHRILWKITHPNDSEEITKNLPQFCKDYNLIYSSMTCVAQGKMKQHKGFKCEHYTV